MIKSNTTVPMLAPLFNLCFDTGLFIKHWYKSNVHPIHKSLETDPRIPTHYRGISLVSCISKVFTGILAKIGGTFAANEQFFVQEQGGFRKGRSCVDQLIKLLS